jgi:hypothetical protein
MWSVQASISINRQATTYHIGARFLDLVMLGSFAIASSLLGFVGIVGGTFLSLTLSRHGESLGPLEKRKW